MCYSGGVVGAGGDKQSRVTLFVTFSAGEAEEEYNFFPSVFRIYSRSKLSLEQFKYILPAGVSLNTYA